MEVFCPYVGIIILSLTLYISVPSYLTIHFYSAVLVVMSLVKTRFHLLLVRNEGNGNEKKEEWEGIKGEKRKKRRLHS